MLSLIDRFCRWWPHWRMRHAIRGEEEFSDFAVNQVEVQDRGLTLTARCPAFMTAIQEGAMLLHESKAENFLEYKALVPGIHPPRIVLITIQWADRLSPAQKIEELQEEIARIKAERSSL